MKQIVEITKVVSPMSRYKGKDALGRSHIIDTDRDLKKGQSVLLVNGVVAGIVATTANTIYEV